MDHRIHAAERKTRDQVGLRHEAAVSSSACVWTEGEGVCVCSALPSCQTNGATPADEQEMGDIKQQIDQIRGARKIEANV